VLHVNEFDMAKSAAKSAASGINSFGRMSAQGVSRMLFFAGLVFIALASAALGRCVYVNVQVMHEVTESIFVSEGSMPLAVMCGALCFAAGGFMWRALCEVIHRLLVKLWRWEAKDR
jgi:p-aminobenzoyl-glutamate transporter AbgT